jgi:alanyl-tRNA synthetase
MNNNHDISWSGNEIRQSFIDFFINKAGHTNVRSSSLVPGGDSTLLFTNAGMVQFKDIFLGKERRQYTRAVNSQKCLRVAGKHNDLEEVGQDDTHHTFFEMLGNWSFGDYYKKEAITWAWELLTEVWKIPKERLFATVFKDELGEIPSDDEAATFWLQQPGFQKNHLFYLGRKDNFWEMADTGPCGPCSEIHFDLEPQDGPITAEMLDTDRFIEFWNLVFIQYNRIDESTLEPLPEKHVDTGMGFERIVNILQEAGSNYRTDLLWPLIQATQAITGHGDHEIEAYFSPYRVIADHARAAAFLIADGVVPGNLGRNYVCRMIIRRAFRFAGKIGIKQPFLAQIALIVIRLYGEAYPELIRNQKTILETITREEEQFQRTLEKATNQLENLFEFLQNQGKHMISGEQAADFYTTWGMPLEITRDIAQERGFRVDESGFLKAMEAHRIASGAGKAMGELGGEDVNVYRELQQELLKKHLLSPQGVLANPYLSPEKLSLETNIIAMIHNSKSVETAHPGDEVEIILPETIFYTESGGQVSDTGIILSKISEDEGTPSFLIQIKSTKKPAAGIISHIGEVVRGHPRVGDQINLRVDSQRRMDIMRNHTATHLLHAALRELLGDHARQAGSLVAPDRLRFDFTHPEALTEDQIKNIEGFVNQKILSDFPLHIAYKPLEEALKEGAIALFGEKYSDEVRNIKIGKETPISNELCGGTHVESTSHIGTFIITNEGSVAAGIRRIEAVTGRQAYKLIQERFQILDEMSVLLGSQPDRVIQFTKNLIADLKTAQKQLSELRTSLASYQFEQVLGRPMQVGGINLLTVKLFDVDAETLRAMSDRFRQHYPQDGIVVLASVIDERPAIIAAVTENLVARGIKAGELAGYVAKQLGGGGGGKPTIAQAGGKDISKIDEALTSVAKWVRTKIDGA